MHFPGDAGNSGLTHELQSRIRRQDRAHPRPLALITATSGSHLQPVAMTWACVANAMTRQQEANPPCMQI